MGKTPPSPVSEEGRAFLQERLSLFGRWFFVVALAYYLITNFPTDPILGYPFDWFTEVFGAHERLQLGIVVCAAILWLANRGRPRSLSVLFTLDAFAVVVPLLLLGIMALTTRFPDREVDELFNVLLASANIIVVRAIAVPSTARRTLVFSTIAYLPVLAATVHVMYTATNLRPRAATNLALSTGLWGAVAITSACITSLILFRLRRAVAEAGDIGQYTLEQKLGSGGMGEVWRARHRLLIRPAALKIIRPEALGSFPGGPDVLLRRFEREARATAALKSPHTVQLYDFGVTDEGTLYYVMELLEGLDLETLVRRFGPVPAERALSILEQACHSLAEAHQAGLVHRDIKPANVFVTRAGGDRDFVKVLDFGLVKLGQAPEASEALSLTDTGAVAGTPAYMAPEVILGEAHIDHRADLYALGCVGYWLLTGRLVFEGETRMKLMVQHAQTPASPPSTRTELPIPPAFERLILDCLAKDPAQRPQGAVELAARLAACEVATPWSADRAEKWWQMHVPEPARTRRLSDELRAQEVHPAVLHVGRRRLG